MKRPLTLLLTALLALEVVFASGVRAEAATIRHCATKADYAALHVGFTRPHVRDILHQRGTATYTSSTQQIRRYRTCAPNGRIAVSFYISGDNRLRLEAASAVWS